jgi:hypothetical protein
MLAGNVTARGGNRVMTRLVDRKTNAMQRRFRSRLRPELAVQIVSSERLSVRPHHV